MKGLDEKGEGIKQKNPHGHKQQYGDYQREKVTEGKNDGAGRRG